jgi:hypothetical protein
MPISTNSEGWQNGEELDRYHDMVLDLLKEDPDSAFHHREIADEVLGTDWSKVHESRRLEDEISEEEYDRRFRSGDLPDSDVNHLAHQFQMPSLEIALSKLLDRGVIEVRQVDADAFDLPSDWDVTTAYSYTGDE